MAQLSKLEERLGVQPIASIGEFQSPEAKALAAQYGITLTAIPELRERLKLIGEKTLESRVASGAVTKQTAAQMLAAQAMFFYELAARKAPIKLVGEGLTGSVAELYGSVIKINPNAATNETFGRLYAEQAAKYLPK